MPGPTEKNDQLPALAADLVGRGVAVIVAGGNNETRAAKAATTTIPIVFASGDDPIKLGHVVALNRPDGNVTGASFFSGSALATKRVELLHEVVPKTAAVAFLVNPSSAQGELETREAQSAAPRLGVQIPVFRASNERDFEQVFAALVEQRLGASVVAGDVLFLTQRDLLVALAARHGIPTAYQLREYGECPDRC